VLFACGDDSSDRHMAAHPVDAGADANASEPPDAGDEDEDADAGPIPMSPGTNVSFETALPVDTRGHGVLQDVRSFSQIDFFSFEAEAGAYYELATGRRSFGPDNVLTLLDPDLNPVAENDDGPRFPGDAIDARLVVRAARSGTYYVRIEDPYTPPQIFSDPSYPLLYYRFWVRALKDHAAGTAHARSASSKPTAVEFFHDDASGYECATLFGELADGEDQVFALSGRAEHALIGQVHKAGMKGDGSSATVAAVTVSDAEHHAIAQIDRDLRQQGIHPPVGDGQFEVRVAGRGDPGPNGFYALDLVLLPDNPRESDDALNGTPEGAETIDMPGAPSRRGLLLSTLPGDDVDYYQFDVFPNETITLVCEGASGGSGVRGLRAELRDESGATLQSGTETPDANLQLDPLEITQQTKLFLRLSRDVPAAGGGESEIEPWTRCVVIAGP
jgi:hypothetical protein